MLRVNLIDRHQSSPMTINKDIAALAKRNDLYTGEDFYFGFDSSNHTFFDIISANEPLAIKHGPTLSLYQRMDNQHSISMYYVDASNKKLTHVISITAKSEDTLSGFNSMLPWSFKDFYLQMTEPPLEGGAEIANKPLSPEQQIELLMEQLATNKWPSEEQINALTDAKNKILAREQDITIDLANLNQLKKNLELESKKPSPDCIIAPYNPFYDNVRISTEFLSKTNPDHITVRQLGNPYPRIEIISPKSQGDDSYSAVYESAQPDLFKSLQKALANTDELVELLSEYFPEIVDTYPILSSGTQKTPR